MFKEVCCLKSGMTVCDSRCPSAVSSVVEVARHGDRGQASEVQTASYTIATCTIYSSVMLGKLLSLSELQFALLR